MGQVGDEVRQLHLRIFPAEEDVLRPFLVNFDINYARRISAAGTQLSAYLLTPDQTMRRHFGFGDEILLVVSNHSQMQSRALQGVEHIFSQHPFRGRADPLTYFIVSRDKNVEHWTADYLVQHPQARSPIPIIWSDTELYARDHWFVRNKLSTRLYSRDLFDYKLPLDDDMLFFGRHAMVDEVIDAVRKGQNRGLFGLRKTGKTSFLFKVMRSLQQSGIGHAIYLDCKLHDIRSLRWAALIDEIARKVMRAAGKGKQQPRGATAAERFMDAISAAGRKHRICLIFDEIEFASPLAKLDVHWHSDFTPFWQTLWSIQSSFRQLSFIIAGVNPFLCETDTFNDVQNPMFGIVTPHFLRGLDRSELGQMLESIGGKMGLSFDSAATAYLHGRYGGHPLLTRMACSYTNRSLELGKAIRPIVIDRPRLQREQDAREEELHFYCRHVVSELKLFYKDEYDMMEMLASGNIVDFLDLAADPGSVRHLQAYGLIHRQPNGKYVFDIPVIQKYVSSERARIDRVSDLRSVVAADHRVEWLERRSQNLINDFRMLLRQAERRGKWQVFAGPLLPESHLLAQCRVAIDWQSFTSFITDLSKFTNESAKVAHGRDVVFTEVKQNYPSLFEAFRRIRLYRNNADHLRLNDKVEDDFKELVEHDLHGRSISQTGEPWFRLQQICLDELFAAVQYELNELAD